MKTDLKMKSGNGVILLRFYKKEFQAAREVVNNADKGICQFM